MFGILLGLYLILGHLAGLKSFGIPYLVPFAAQRKEGYRGLRVGILILPTRFRKRRPLYARKEQKIRLKMKNGGN